MNYNVLIDTLLESNEPSIRWKVRVNLLNEDQNSSQIKALEQQIKNSDRVRSLLQKVNEAGILVSNRNIYDKFQGAHWVLVTLSDIGYPKYDNTLIPIANQVLDFWLQDRFFSEYTAVTKADAYKGKDAIPVIQGRHRICGSQHADTLLAMLRLGLKDERIHDLAERLRCWQWPDGGWNCDKNADAKTSTIPHTFHCMRALSLYAEETGDIHSAECALRASEYLLKRRLFKRLSNGKIIKPDYLKLHYPLYWHYDILGALKGLAEMGLVGDRRCDEALDVLEKKQLPTGGWPAEGRYYQKVTNEFSRNADYVDWGGTSKRRMNQWVTVDALCVLEKAGRL